MLRFSKSLSAATLALLAAVLLPLNVSAKGPKSSPPTGSSAPAKESQETALPGRPGVCRTAALSDEWQPRTRLRLTVR